MKAQLLAAALAAFLVVACTNVEPAADMGNARYARVVATEAVAGGGGLGRQRIMVRFPDGTTAEVVQQRDSGILVGDVVRVLGEGKDQRVQRL
jgi:LmbE family N-acetylglucosaminyl deacetylase